MSVEGVLLVLAGVFIAFWGQFFIRLAVGLVSGLWLGWLASSLTTHLLKEHAFTSFLAGLVVFATFFVLGLIKYKFVASFFLSALIAYYLPVETIFESVTNYSLSYAQLILLRVLIFFGLLVITYAAFKLLIGLVASSLGSVLTYAGLVVLGIPQTLTLLVTTLLFVTSLFWYVSKKK